MRLVKPNWLIHSGEKKDFEVYSCHVSPDGTRLVTAGGDGHVRIWSTEAILKASDPSYTKPKQLASLSYHSGTIHSVRFSGNGKYLASGADDKIVCVYTLDAGAPVQRAAFGSKEQPPVENWRIYRRLIGHDNDVQDIGWSYDSSILVSVGLDSKVVVWSGYTFEKLKTLSQHQSHVKGITFDPANKYFATASDDRSIKIYRFTSPPANATPYDQTNNFQLEHTVTAPFAGSPLTTYFRRCSWSPEGAYIAAANAVNGPVSSVAIVNRGTWNSEINLIGHEGPVEVCAFSPRMFTRTPVKPGAPDAPSAVTVVACAGQDKTVSIWNTSLPRPITTGAEVAAKPISDLAWSPDGETIYVSSLDGGILAMVFESGELGYPTDIEETNGKALAKYGGGRTRAGLVEDTDALKLEEGARQGDARAVEGRMGELMGDAQATTGALANGDSAPKVNGTVPTNNGTPADPPPAVEPPKPKDPQQERVEKLKQKVTITKDGRKRIAPVLVSASNQGEANLPKPQLQAAVKSGATGSDDPAGKVLDLSKPYDGLPKGGLASLLLGNKRKYAELDDGEGGNANSKRVQAVQSTGATPIVNNTEAGLATASASTSKKLPIDLPEVLRPAIVNPSLSVSQVRLAVPQIRAVVNRPLDPTKSTSADSDLANGTGPGDDADSIIFEARNASGPSRTGRVQDRDPTRVAVTKRNQVIWQDFLPKSVLLVTGNRRFWAAGCEDGRLHIWTPAGRRLLNALVMEAQPVILDCRGWWLLAITAVGQAYVWNVKSMKAAHPPVSLAPVLDAASASMQGHLTAAPALMFARLNSQGRIVLGLSNGDGFAYNPNMFVWQQLSESWWAVGSQYWNTTDTSASKPSALSNGTASKKRSGKDKEAEREAFMDEITPENISAGIIPLLERNTTSQALIKGRAYFLQRLVKQLLNAEGYEGFESSVSVSHLENRIAAAMALGAKDEFRVYLIMYAKRLGAEGLKIKVEELLRGLLGRIVESSSGGGDGGAGDEDDDDEPDDDACTIELGDGGDEVVGWKRDDLLKEVIMVLGRSRELQRITVPYARVVGMLDKLVVKDGGGMGDDVEMGIGG